MIVYLLIGAAAGLLSGLFGIGGGVIVVPALSYVFLHDGTHTAFDAMHAAVATSLAVMIMTSLSALYAHQRARSVRWVMISPMLPGLVVSSLIGAAIAHYLPSSILRIFFGIFLIYIGWPLIFGQTTLLEPKTISVKVLRIISLCVGALSGVLGVGGGALLAPIFLRAGLNMHETAGTSVVCGLTIGLTTTLGFLFLQWFGRLQFQAGSSYIDFSAFTSVAVASVLLAPFGAKLARRLPRIMARRIFGFFLLCMALDMLLTAR